MPYFKILRAIRTGQDARSSPMIEDARVRVNSLIIPAGRNIVASRKVKEL